VCWGCCVSSWVCTYWPNTENRKPAKYGEPFTLTVSVNLKDSVFKILKLLEHSVTQAERLNGDPSSFNFYIDTYLDFITMKAAHPEIRFVPSLEVEWVWFSTQYRTSNLQQGHVLRPKFYEAYCMKNFGRLIPHDLDDWILGHEDPSALKETAGFFEEVDRWLHTLTDRNM
jgi:hypothetical protein